ncbi:hypothetical protein, variant [Saprolegnia diclina VS20]|uniref:Thioesterase n=1 Tax=Saprolegnia diclina (strain VS20) TaxID=1156394 RepID=T0QCA6_SAPDV|nr:hypothetical protein, variant [Saprolegnia diclina VS20]EQC31195.1 hypothetical protein, variant [Saprolegnia diclina VS20]|eukprot:XP_008615367.1 hypothetical protein, variant [Saprolegnia diclina VS20]
MTIPRILWNMGAGLLRRRFSPPTPGLLLIDRPSIWKTRIGAIDTDLNLHLNNASYLTQMESATWFAVGASGILVEILRQRWLFLVVSQAIRYRHPIPPLRPFHIHSTIVYWDADWLYLQHRFVCPATGTLYAQSIVRVMIRLGKATVSPTTMYRTVTKDESRAFTPPAMPDEVRDFLAWERSCAHGMQQFAAPSRATTTPTSFNWPWTTD